MPFTSQQVKSLIESLAITVLSFGYKINLVHLINPPIAKKTTDLKAFSYNSSMQLYLEHVHEPICKAEL